MKNIKLVILIVLSVLVAGGVLVLLKGRSSSTKVEADRVGFSPQVPEGAHLITMNPEGFEPSEISIKKGETVSFVNEDSEYRWPASNIHPTHEIYPDFDPLEPVKPGEVWSFTFDEAGEWRFHDHLLPRFTGTIRVSD
jgi:plastocyanin